MADPIFRGYDRAALDAQYNNRDKVPTFQAHIERRIAAARLAGIPE